METISVDRGESLSDDEQCYFKLYFAIFFNESTFFWMNKCNLIHNYIKLSIY